MKSERKMTRRPTTPGEVLDHEFLKPSKMTQAALARHLGCDVKTINRLVRGRHGVNAEMALKLSAAFGTSPEFWLNLQKAVDLYEARQSIGDALPARLDMRAVG